MDWSYLQDLNKTMADTIPPGAYIIRNRQTSAVLQINPTKTEWERDVAEITANEQDEEKYREQQIWWIEADPCYEELNAQEEKTVKEGGVYRITSIAKTQSIEHGSNPVVGFETHGAPWQLWRLRQRKSCDDG